MKKFALILLIIDAAMIIFLLTMFDKARAEYVSSPSGLCIRERPGTGSEVLEVLPFGAEVAGEIEEGWMRLEGREGYVCAEHLQAADPFEEMQYMGEWRVTAYAETGMPCANGNYPETGYTIACNSLLFGTEVYIEGVGFRTVEDRGPASMGDEWLDLYLGDHTACVNWGNQYRKIWVKG
jgi:3D (Asp-Asp-Asp) domain-containing protein